jgi:hypothetical protein
MVRFEPKILVQDHHQSFVRNKNRPCGQFELLYIREFKIRAQHLKHCTGPFFWCGQSIDNGLESKFSSDMCNKRKPEDQILAVEHQRKIT